jgi:ribose-phosphate pyrophosphokinase
MTMRLFIPLPGNETLAAELARLASATLGSLDTRHFPDGESYVRLVDDIAGKDVDFVCTLARPDDQMLRLIFAAATARELGAKSVRLIAPYLAYMRQDKRFLDGESISSTHFAKLLSDSFDNLITIDPHLHRITDLAEIFSIPTKVAHAAPLLADWIKNNVENALVVGPDSESGQWVKAVAQRAGAEQLVLEKKRLGDNQVEISMPDLSNYERKVPVLVDDIISSGRTMIETAEALIAHGFPKPYILTVHALFSGSTYRQLNLLARDIVSTYSVPHETSRIGIAELLL